MGNFLGLGKSDENILNFDGVRTDMSSTIPYMHKLNANAQLLANRLNNKVLIEPKEFNESENYDMYKLFEKTQSLDKTNNNFSDTSPFISSDVYKNLINTQKGGGDKSSSSSSSSEEGKKSTMGKKSTPVKSSKKSTPVKKSQKNRKNKGKESTEDSLEESSTSSDSSSSSSSNRKKKGKKEKKEKKKEESDDSDDEIVDILSSDSDEEIEVPSDTIISVGGSSYLSSSANDSDSSIKKHKGKKTKQHLMLSDSINTSDINMISVED